MQKPFLNPTKGGRERCLNLFNFIFFALVISYHLHKDL